MSDLTAADWKLRSASIPLPQHAVVEGRKVPAQSGARFDCRFPGTGKVLAKVAACSSPDVDLGGSQRAPRIRDDFMGQLACGAPQGAAAVGRAGVNPSKAVSTGDVPAVAGCLSWYAEAIDNGLAVGIWTNNVKTAFRVAKAVRAGVVWVNCFDVGRMSVAFGGVKQSGFGRDKSLHALDKYSYVKSVWLAH